jgi:multidrug resistance protein, MATE family
VLFEPVLASQKRRAVRRLAAAALHGTGWHVTLDRPILRADDTWWSKPSGGREVLRVAAPLVVSSLSWTIMAFFDRMFLYWVSGEAMDASFTSSIAWFAILALPLGICAYANTFVAQYDGAGRQDRIGLAMWQAVWIGAGLGILSLVLIPLAPALFGLAQHTPETYAHELQYFQIICLCGPGLLISEASKSFYSGRGQTWVVMVVDAAIAIFELVLNYVWIFGYWGFPAMGLAGAAWSTVVGTCVKAIVYVVLPLQREHRERFGILSGMRFDAELMRRIMYFGWPSGFQMLLDVTGFTVFIFMLGALGDVAKQATSLAFSVSSLAFMPIYGLHIAVSILVGERLGENRDDLAAEATKTTLQMSWLYMAFISLMYAFLPDVFLVLFFRDGVTSTAEQLAVRELTATLLLFVAGYNLLDATQMIYIGALKGAGDTRFLLWVSLVLATLLASFSYLSVKVWQLDIYGCWTLIVFWCLIAAVTYFVRYRQGKWRGMRVIESPSDDSIDAMTIAAVD